MMVRICSLCGAMVFGQRLRTCLIRSWAGVALVPMLIQIGCTVDSSHALIGQDRKVPTSWTVSNGTVELKVDGSVGRVMFYGYKDGRNVLWTNSQPDNPKYVMGGWTNHGGDKVWPWPQEYWNWPPPEPKGYDIQIHDGGRSLQMTSTPLPGYRIRIVRLIEMAPKGTKVMFTTYFQPVGNGFDQPLAAWSITQIPWPERVLVRMSVRDDRQSHVQSAPAKDDSFLVRILSDSILELGHPGDHSAKTFLDADLIACVYDDVLFIQRQLAVPGSDAWKPKQRAQIFFHGKNAGDIPPGSNYGELEWTAALASPHRLGLNPLRITWNLVQTRQKLSDSELVSLLEGS